MPRRCALNALLEWENGSRFSDEIFRKAAERAELKGPDRSLAQDIFYGTLRNLILLDELIERFRKGRIKLPTQCLLRIGLYQLFCSEIADHAAINETVSLAKKHEKGLVNAILRNAQRQQEELEKEIPTWSLAERYSHPEFLVDRWENEFGSDATEAILEWNNSPSPNYGRIHSLSGDEEGLNRVRSETQPCLVGEDFPDFFSFEGAPNTEWIEKGWIYIQDPSTSVSCRLLNPQPGETILDACAAPGGKTAFLADLMGNSGQIIATDSSPKRLDRLEKNLQRLHVKNTEVRAVDWKASEPDGIADLPKFDAILLDAPCSNSGVMRRRIDVRWRLYEGEFERQAKTQIALLNAMKPLLKPGGRIVYSTCSIDQAENEAVAEQSGLEIGEIVHCRPWMDDFDGAFAAQLRAQ